MRIITGLGLPTLKAFRPVAVSSMATMAPQPGRVPCCVGQFGSRFVAISLAPPMIIRAAASTISKVNARPSPTDDVIGIVIDDRVAVGVQRLQQPPFADDVGRAARKLLGQEPRRGHGAGEDVLLLDVDAHPRQAAWRRRAACAGCCWSGT